MAAEAEAGREARAKVIAAEGEHQASRALKDAAEVISSSPAAIQLRYLQVQFLFICLRIALEHQHFDMCHIPRTTFFT